MRRSEEVAKGLVLQGVKPKSVKASVLVAFTDDNIVYSFTGDSRHLMPMLSAINAQALIKLKNDNLMPSIQKALKSLVNMTKNVINAQKANDGEGEKNGGL